MILFTENRFTNFSPREVPSSARVGFGNPPIWGLEYILYFGEISLGVTPRFSFFKEGPSASPIRRQIGIKLLGAVPWASSTPTGVARQPQVVR